MARISKTNALKSKVKTKATKPTAEMGERQGAARKGIKLVEAPVQEPTINAKPTPEADKATSDKKVSQKLLETIERRKKVQGAAGKANSNFGRPAGRRGRRPKAAVEYTPGNQEEEAYVLESDYEGLEYDTGIRVKEGGDDRGFAVERFDDFDEELNFDW